MLIKKKHQCQLNTYTLYLHFCCFLFAYLFLLVHYIFTFTSDVCGFFFFECVHMRARKNLNPEKTPLNIIYIFTLCIRYFHYKCIYLILFFLTDIKKLQIADGRNLRFDRSIKVFKRGGTTGETEGYLSDNSLSVCLDFTNGFYFFDRCYAVESINSPFFEPGDSGSGVFLIENGVPTKPLGIAFAFQKRSQTTAVCRIDKIIDAFNLSVYQYEEESMET